MSYSFYQSLSPCLKYHREGHWAINCLDGMETSDPDNSKTDLLGVAIND